MKTGHVLNIFIAPEAAAEMQPISTVQTLTGRGLEGDRYCAKAGIFSKKQGNASNATFIEMEAIEALERDYGVTLDPRHSRRNILTQGVALNHLVGAEFRVGEVTFRGVELCEPCRYLESKAMSGKPLEGVRKGMIHRGGLRAEVLSDGRIHIGDAITPLNHPENIPQDAPHLAL
jgi:MOSC domain-containing protein YiiM